MEIVAFIISTNVIRVWEDFNLMWRLHFIEYKLSNILHKKIHINETFLKRENNFLSRYFLSFLPYIFLQILTPDLTVSYCNSACWKRKQKQAADVRDKNPGAGCTWAGNCCEGKEWKKLSHFHRGHLIQGQHHCYNFFKILLGSIRINSISNSVTKKVQPSNQDHFLPIKLYNKWCKFVLYKIHTWVY